MPATWANVFPNLAATGYTVTSPDTPIYNCIAWAADDDTKWWWPDPDGQCYWPALANRQETITAFVAAYSLLGYRVCPDGAFEEGWDKIAIFTLNDSPKHAAKQIGDNLWTSKIGRFNDISHTLDGLDGPDYGRPTVFMKRKKP